MGFKVIDDSVKIRIVELRESGIVFREIAKKLGVSIAFVHTTLKAHRRNDEGVIGETVPHSEVDADLNSNQLVADLSRIDRKLYRSEARFTNAIEATFEEMYKRLGVTNLPRPAFVPPTATQPVGVITLSDLHFGEVINLKHNKFNLEIAKERLDKYLYECIKLFQAHKVKYISVVFLGDIINSDRRPDELLTNAQTNAESLVDAFQYFTDAIEKLYTMFHIVSIESVVGNESRLDKDLSVIDKLLINNFDYIFHQMLKRYFQGIIPMENITREDAIEKVVTHNGYNLLLTHGFIGKRNGQPYELLKSAKDRNPEIDGIVCGHIHSPLVSLNFARNGGLPGANAYSLRTLGIPYEAPSQNVHIIDNKKLNSFIINLE